jgi:hypothetical protein
MSTVFIVVDRATLRGLLIAENGSDNHLLRLLVQKRSVEVFVRLRRR